MTLEYFSKRTEKILVVIFLIYSIFLLSHSAFFGNPAIMGDGHEYLGMTCSFFNHFTPDLRGEDIVLRDYVENKNNIHFPEKYNYGGYFKSLHGAYYSYHFWAYSLFNLPVFSFLHYFNLNELRCFQITNSLLLILSLGFIVYFASLNKLQKVWFFLLCAFNPVLFYIGWSHPEVFSYSFVIIAITFALQKKYYLAVMCSSIASLQCPPIVILTLYLLISGLKLSYERYHSGEAFRLLMFSSVSILPYIFYYVNYHKFSLIAGRSAKIESISINKILSIFFDPNFGIIAYMPIILILALLKFAFDVKNKKTFALTIWAVIMLMATIYATQGNWNPGIMYIHRYTIPMIPLLILMSVKVFEHRPKINTILLTIALISMVCTVSYFLYEYDESNHLSFSGLANTILINTPDIYNPHPEIFTERAVGREESEGSEWYYINQLPVIYCYGNKPRKILCHSEDMEKLSFLFNFSINQSDIVVTKNNLIYINYPPMIQIPNSSKIRIMHKWKEDMEDIVPELHLIKIKRGEGWTRHIECHIFIADRIIIELSGGFYNLEHWQDTPTRWTSNNATILIYSPENRDSNLSFNVGSFYKPRNFQVYLNNELIHEQNILTSFVEVEIPVKLKQGENVLRFYTADGCQRPVDIPELNNMDSRCLSLAFQNITLITIKENTT
jgi:hypothetical protein